MDTLIQFLIEELIGHLLFGVGRFVLQVMSLGRIRLDKPTRFQAFVVIVIGLVTTIAALGGVVSLARFWL